jgi:myo-inositol-1-phosphate synthase
MEPGVEDAVKKAIRLLEELGAAVEETSLPHTPYALAVYYIIAPSEASANLARYDGVKYGYSAQEADGMWDALAKTRQQGFGPEVKRRIMLGTYALSAGYYDAYYLKAQKVHESLRNFEQGLEASDPSIAPSMIYAYAALKSRIAYCNGAPNLTVDIPALQELAQENRAPISGKDFKTGQTLMKTILAPGLKARMLGVQGWFSSNILGNRDGEVLDDPDSFKTKEESKLSVLDTILQPEQYPDLYGEIYHKVRIHYYPPRGDNKEGWDNIDLFGWLGYPMQLKIDFLCRDSILAAPLVLDLVLLSDLAQRAGMKGIQEWLSFYYKSPMTAPGLYPEHNLFIQEMKLKNTLRYLMGEEQITHLGLEYYE